MKCISTDECKGKLRKKEVYKDSAATVTVYCDNRKVKEIGYIKTTTTLEG